MNHAIPLLFGPYGSSALPYLDQFAAYDANTLWFHGFNGAAFDACARHGIAAYYGVLAYGNGTG